MEKIKDIIYEYSDTAIGFIIVFVMVAVIGWQLYNWFEPAEKFKIASGTLAASTSADGTEKENSSNESSHENTDDNTADSTDKGDVPSEKSEDREKNTSGNVVFQIKQGSSCEQIAFALEQTGLIDSKEDFLEQIISRQLENKLKTGTYTIEKGESINDIIATLTK